MTWAATLAKAKFSEVLDKAETEGPQLVRRRKQEFLVITREQHDASQAVRGAGAAGFVSAWDALAPSSGATFDVKLSRRKGKLKAATF